MYRPLRYPVVRQDYDLENLSIGFVTNTNKENFMALSHRLLRERR
jgi:hypothetical protein